MSNSYYNHTTYPTPNSPGSSAQLRAELELITTAFGKLPTLSGNGYQVAMVNAAGTALVPSAALQNLALTNSTLNSTPIGATTAAAGTFTNLTATGAVNLGNSVSFTGGSINNTVIGNLTPAAGYFTTLVASSGVIGNITGNVAGNLTGNVIGNVTGNLTGNVTSSGTSSFSNVTISGTLDMDGGSSSTIINLSAPVNAGDAATKGYVDTGLALKLNLAGGTMSGAIAMGANKITGMADPTLAQDAATKAYTDTGLALKLNLTGGTLSGALAMGANKITGVANPTLAQDAATKAYTDTGLALKLNLSGGTMSGDIAMNGFKVTGMANPSNDQDGATKNYVDSVAQGLSVKGSVRVATTGNITLSTLQTIDGITVVAGDRVLVKDQSAPANNGIYLAATGPWTRTTDADAWTELVSAFVFVSSGTLNASNGYVCTVVAGGTLGTTPITFQQFSGAGQITAGAGMTKSGNTLDVGTASATRIVVNADDIDLATTGVTASTYKSVTVDAYGRVTAGTNPTTISGFGITDAYTKTEVDSGLALKLNLAGGTMSGAIAMGANKITGMADPTLAQDAATKAYTDTGLALKLNLTGGTLSGALAMGANKITGLADPGFAQDAATKAYTDAADALKLNLTGGTMSGAIAMGSNRITGVADPLGAQDAATKNYIDTLYGSTVAAATSAAAAAASASAASTSETNAAGSASSALSSANAAAASYDEFDDRYLGAKSVDPTVDNDGNPLLTGALYWSTALSAMKAYNGTIWQVAYAPSSVYVQGPASATDLAVALFDGTSGKLVRNSGVTIDGSNVITAPGISLTTGSISTAPSALTDLVNKQYVDDAVSAGIHIHTPVRVEEPDPLTVTYNNGSAGVGATLTNAGTQAALVIDGVTMALGDRVLIYQQATASQNGIYTVTNLGSGSTNWVLTRASDANTYAVHSTTALCEGTYVFVQQGLTGGGESYVMTTSGAITFGTTPITFTQFSDSTVYTNGTGLSLVGQTFSITPVGTAGTYGSASSVPVFTTNASGQITGVTATPIAINGSAVTGSISGAAGSVANTLTRGGYLTGSNFNGSAATTWAVDATDANTASKVVARDASGNFSAGTITAALSGNATTATTLATPRAINGVNFNGSAPITITASTTAALTAGSFLTSGGTFDGSTARTFAVDATSANTASKVVARDASGNFSAGTITAALSGNATTSSSTTGNAATVTNGVYTTGDQTIGGNKTYIGKQTISKTTTVTVGSAGGSDQWELFNNGSGGTIMSFHRSGAYAINMGLDTDNVFRLGGWSNGTNIYRIQSDTSGNFTAQSNVTAYSDERLKKDWLPIGDSFVERLAKLRHGTFTRIDTGERQVGVSAQGLQKFMPEAVMADASKRKIRSVAYGNAALVAAVKLAERILVLEARIASLEAK